MLGRDRPRSGAGRHRASPTTPAAGPARRAVLAGVIGHVRDIRRVGSAALDLCSVACGRVDAYYELGLAPWDLAAGALIAREAGAVVQNLHGGRTVEPVGAWPLRPRCWHRSSRALLAAGADG